MRRFALAQVVVVAMAVSACATSSVPQTALDDAPPQMLNAFFGLDDALPPVAAMLCPEGPGADGMPVTFSHRLLGDGPEGANVDPSAFVVVTRSGQRKMPACATLRPAVDDTEGHTVLLIGDLGDGEEDPPVRVEVVGPLPLQGGGDANGLVAPVTALEDGPSLVLALQVPRDAVDSACPEAAPSVVIVVWAGGVQPVAGATDDDHRQMYTLVVDDSTTTPVALGDINDNDNYVHLCVDDDVVVDEVRATAGGVVDPRNDANPATWVQVSR